MVRAPEDPRARPRPGDLGHESVQRTLTTLSRQWVGEKVYFQKLEDWQNHYIQMEKFHPCQHHLTKTDHNGVIEAARK